MTEDVALRIAARLVAGFSRQAFGLTDLNKLNTFSVSFGVISAYRAGLSKHQNQIRHGKLVADLQKAGFSRPVLFKSHWEDMATHVSHKEKSLLVPGISFETLCALAEKYEQDAVLFKDPSGSIGIYDKHGNATMAYESDGSMAVESRLDTEGYSKTKDMSFGLVLNETPFTYGGYSTGSPVTNDMIVESLS